MRRHCSGGSARPSAADRFSAPGESTSNGRRERTAVARRSDSAALRRAGRLRTRCSTPAPVISARASSRSARSTTPPTSPPATAESRVAVSVPTTRSCSAAATLPSGSATTTRGGSGFRVERFPCSERPNRPATALRLSGMQSRGDSWESSGWEAEGDPDRAELLELARRLAEQHRRQSADALAEVEDLKRALRERAADVARRELEVERRTKELDAQEEHGRRALRLR